MHFHKLLFVKLRPHIIIIANVCCFDVRINASLCPELNTSKNKKRNLLPFSRLFFRSTSKIRSLPSSSVIMFQQGITIAAFCLLSFTWHGTGFSIPNHQHKQHRLHAQNHMTLETASSTTSNSYLHDWNLDPYDLDNDTLITLAVDMFSTYDVSQFGVKEEQIRSFLKEVQGRYNRHPAFHTFHHAWATMFLTYQILRRGEADMLLSPLAAFALLVASVCHDLDHPGNNNGFEVGVPPPSHT